MSTSHIGNERVSQAVAQEFEKVESERDLLRRAFRGVIAYTERRLQALEAGTVIKPDPRYRIAGEAVTEEVWEAFGQASAETQRAAVELRERVQAIEARMAELERVALTRLSLPAPDLA